MNLKSIYLVAMTGLLVSCSEDFTDLAPVSQRNVENFYRTAGDMETAVNAIYATLQNAGCYNESFWVMHELRSDNTFWDGTGLARIVSVIDDFVEDASNEVIIRGWNDPFLGASRANIVLSRIGAIDMDAALKDQYRGEALFLRSLFYYHLALSYGNIPLVLTETATVSEGAGHTQVPAATVYAQLITDLGEAENLLPTSATGANTGRATKGAAATLLARVLLTTGDNGVAEAALRRIVNNYGYELVSNYADLWGVANEHNTESIFEVEFQGGFGNQGNVFTNQFYGPLAASVVSGVRNIPEQDLLDTYEDGDARFDASILIEADMSVSSKKWGTENSNSDDDASNNWIVFRYADVLLMLAEAIGEGAEAYGLINEVRARAGLGSIDGNTPGTFAEKLLKERRVELAFENHRWDDLLRFGVAESKISAQGNAANLLFAIPQRELDLNPGFSQNPGY